ncbi:MAG TPA: hypothetical protein VKZ53_04250 [Candidatus Angelobacter sp.]|nr:hypothetical protein [Candidatus Angelobacter sp.]
MTLVPEQDTDLGEEMDPRERVDGDPSTPHDATHDDTTPDAAPASPRVAYLPAMAAQASNGLIRPAEVMNPAQPSSASAGPGNSAGSALQASTGIQPPVPPAANPELAGNEADLRGRAAVTPKYDPTTGKTLEQYKPGVGARIGRAFADLARGGVPGVVEGAFGNRNSPGYYGPGAVNAQYFRDELARRQAVQADQERIGSLQREDSTAQRDYRNQLEAYKDKVGATDREAAERERERSHRAEEEIRQQQQNTRQDLADAKAFSATDPSARASSRGAPYYGSPSYDPQSGRFMRDGVSVQPRSNDEGWAWEIAAGITKYSSGGRILSAGPYTRAALSERKNQPIHVPQPSIPQPQISQPNASQPNVQQPNVQQPQVTRPRLTPSNVPRSISPGSTSLGSTQSSSSQSSPAQSRSVVSGAATRSANTDVVKIQKPDGTTGTIPRTNLKAALAKGWKQIR